MTATWPRPWSYAGEVWLRTFSFFQKSSIQNFFIVIGSSQTFFLKITPLFLILLQLFWTEKDYFNLNWAYCEKSSSKLLEEAEFERIVKLWKLWNLWVPFQLKLTDLHRKPPYLLYWKKCPFWKENNHKFPLILWKLLLCGHFLFFTQT